MEMGSVSHDISPSNEVVTNVLVIGAGPAGASLACFLARYGVQGLMISSAPSTADTPRAHITALSTLDALRDLGVADECYKLGNQGNCMKHYRWCETLAEEEYGRVYAWGHDPLRKGDYERASPNPRMLDLPQDRLEPILVKFARSHGFEIAFNTELISFKRDKATGEYSALVRNGSTGRDHRIRCKYLFGADGGKSVVVEQLDLPMQVLPPGGNACNIQLRCNIPHLIKGREANLHLNLRLKREDGWMINVRMIKPWHEWMMVALPKDPSSPPRELSIEEWIEVWRDLIDDQKIDVEIIGTSRWKVNNTCAERYSEGNAFCLGDAVHRHPPAGGLGSNTCVGDAFNLAWKANLVIKGIASPSLLDSYTIERQPVGAEVVRVSNLHLKSHIPICEVFGLQGSSASERTGLKLLKENTNAGRQARKHLQDLLNEQYHNTHALGLDMGYRYDSSAIYTADELEPWKPTGMEAVDRILYYSPSTYPGRRLPHVWLGQNRPSELYSTLDLAGKGDFCLFTGIGGRRWRAAAKDVSIALNVPLKAFSIGIGEEWEDLYGHWTELRGVEEDGCVLVRPDLFCAWRSQTSLCAQEDCTLKLQNVMRSILGWNG